MRIHKRRSLGIAAGVVSLALIATACSSGSGDGDATAAPTDNETTSSEPVTLTVNVFGQGGYEGDVATNLFDKYMEEFPNVTIESTNLGTGGDAQTAVLNMIGAGGAGLPDVQMIEEGWRGWMSDLAADNFVDLRDFGADDLKDRWVDWKVGQATNPDGQVWGYGTDIGPQGLCFDQTQVAAAGIANDRDEFVEALGGADATWDKFWEVGEKYTAATGKPWVGVPSFVWNSAVNQQEEGYYKADGVTLNIEDNQFLKDLMTTIVEQSNAGVAGKLNAWAWQPEDFHGNFAVHVCPGWMLGSIRDAVTNGGTDKWDFADVFPGGATNWGGSFFAVPKVSKNQEEAAKLAAWLTAPEQQIVAFQNAGAFPSQVEAQSDPAVTEFTDADFSDAPVGQILAHRAEGVVPQIKGPQDATIQDTVIGGVMTQINAGQITTPEAAWQAVLDGLVANQVG